MNSPLSQIDQLSLFTDAIARGRLCLGEVAGISPEELDALFEFGAQRLEANRLEEAIPVFGGLITLFPYRATHWRAYGVALHRSGRFPQAEVAYRAALLLHPGHLPTLLYQGEVLLMLAEAAQARALLEEVAASSAPRLAATARRLLDHIEKLPPAETSPTPAPATPDLPEDLPPESTSPYFELPDGRSLPLHPSPFQEEDTLEGPTPIQSAPDVVYHGPPAPTPHSPPVKERTQTAIVPRRSLRKREDTSARAENTAILPRSRVSRSLKSGEPLSTEGTETAVVKRRSHQPLHPESTELIPRSFFLPLETEESP